ncbi:hypothetical protein C8Q79DRAFT_103616 [Trametes meyenii]|nr:hypothetical protein C8Q79DRAFT_103616 [Trametes meyenii]
MPSFVWPQHDGLSAPAHVLPPGYPVPRPPSSDTYPCQQLSTASPDIAAAQQELVASTTTTSALAPVGQRRRPRGVKVACTNCRHICKRCDEARPCQRCVKRNMAGSCMNASPTPRARRRPAAGERPSADTCIDAVRTTATGGGTLSYAETRFDRVLFEEQDSDPLPLGCFEGAPHRQLPYLAGANHMGAVSRAASGPADNFCAVAPPDSTDSSASCTVPTAQSFWPSVTRAQWGESGMIADDTAGAWTSPWFFPDSSAGWLHTQRD